MSADGIFNLLFPDKTVLRGLCPAGMDDFHLKFEFGSKLRKLPNLLYWSVSEIIDSSLRTAVKGTTIVLLGMVVSNLLWFLTKFLIVRNITAEELGLYSLVVATVSIISLMACLGIHEGATKYVAQFAGEGRKSDAESISKAALQVGMISGITFFLLLFLFSGTISKVIFYKPEIEKPLRIMSFFVPFNVLTLIMAWILRGYGIIRARVYYLEIGVPFFFLLSLSVLLIFKLSFVTICYAYVFSMLVAFLAISIYGRRQVGLSPIEIRSGTYHKQLLEFSVSIFILSASLAVFASTDTLMLGRYAEAKEVGFYSIAFFLANLLPFPYNAFGFVFMPIAGEMFAKNQTAELKKTYRILTKWIFSATLPIFFVLFFFPEMTITYLFGRAFDASVAPLRILSVGFMVQSFFGASVILMIVVGLSQAIRRVSLFATIMNILLNYVFIKLLGYGIIGASFATMLSYVFLSAMNLLILFKSSGIHPFSLEYLKPIVTACLSGFLIYLIAKSLPLYPWMIPFYLVVFVACYLASILMTRSIEKEEVEIMTTILGKLGVSNNLSRFIGRLAK